MIYDNYLLFVQTCFYLLRVELYEESNAQQPRTA